MRVVEIVVVVGSDINDCNGGRVSVPLYQR